MARGVRTEGLHAYSTCLYLKDVFKFIKVNQFKILIKTQLNNNNAQNL